MSQVRLVIFIYLLLSETTSLPGTFFQFENRGWKNRLEPQQTFNTNGLVFKDITEVNLHIAFRNYFKYKINNVHPTLRNFPSKLSVSLRAENS